MVPMWFHMFDQLVTGNTTNLREAYFFICNRQIPCKSFVEVIFIHELFWYHLDDNVDPFRVGHVGVQKSLF